MCPDMIRDGTGKGYLAQVTENNKLRGYATCESEISYESEVNERAYTWTYAYNYTGADTILWLRNDSTTLNLIIDRILIASDTATRVILHFPANLAPSGTVVRGINLNRKSNLVADASCYGNEINNVQANIFANALIPANVPAILPAEGSIVLGYLDCVAIDFVTTGTLGMVTFRAYYHDV